MAEQVHVLYRDGRIEAQDAKTTDSYQQVDGETDPKTLTPFDSISIVVRFNSIADGRGFSLVKSIRRDLAYQGNIYASGDINPDQLSYAFQVGFDAVLVSPERWQEYGESSWRSAVSPVVKLSYSQTKSESLQSIWQKRHAT